MPIAKSHGRPKKAERKAEMYVADGKYITKDKEYNAVDGVIDQVYADIAKGVSKSEIFKKLKGKLYDGQVKELKYRSCQYYYNAAIERFQRDKDDETDKLRAVYYGRFEMLFNEAIKKNDLYNANNILQSMCRIFGLEQKTPQTAIQINGSDDGKVVVNFGFNKLDGDGSTD